MKRRRLKIKNIILLVIIIIIIVYIIKNLIIIFNNGHDVKYKIDKKSVTNAENYGRMLQAFLCSAGDIKNIFIKT